MWSKNVVACWPLIIFAAVNSMVAQTTGPTLVGAWEFTATPESGTYAPAPSVEGLATFTSIAPWSRPTRCPFWDVFLPDTEFGNAARFRADTFSCGL